MTHRDLYRFVLASALYTVIPNIALAQLTLLNDQVLDGNALLMPSNATYGRAINGVSFQAEPLLTYGGYQYATWYHNGTDEDVYVARRALTGNTWETFDTGSNLDNGDSPAWDAHNVISLGISGDDRMHFAWDLHGHTLRLRDSDPGDATGVTWDASLFNAERSSLAPGGATISTLTYPQFTTDPATGDMFINYRTGGSGAGNQYIATYDSMTGAWNSPHEFINGTASIFYDDDFGSSSSNRNAYLNGLDIDSTGRIHTTWTWRETATGSSNHDIMYAYSDDGGNTWLNNAGAVVATVGSPMNMNSPGIIIVPMDRGNTLMNQQTQAVDLDNRVHMVMWHKRDGAAPVTGFTTAPADYFHYYRDPVSGVWTRTELPAERAVGSRPDMAYDENGNLYVVYVSPGPGDAGGYYTNGDLIVATASKAAGYEDWEIAYTDTRDFSGEPFVDLKRLLDDDVVSVVIQENSPNTGRTGSPLHVLEFDKLANKVVWAGDDTGDWTVGSGTDWDNDNNNVGEESFADGYRVIFDDGAADFSVNIASPVAPASTTFVNTSAQNYVLTGTGIGGSGPLVVSGGGNVTLANSANTYMGDTFVDNGALALVGSATIDGSPNIVVSENATLNVSGLAAGHLPLGNQTLTVDGTVQGNVVAMNNSQVQLSDSAVASGDLTLESGSLVAGTGIIAENLQVDQGTVRVGGAGLPTISIPTSVTIDDFNDGNLSEYTATAINDGSVAAPNVTFANGAGELAATYAGSSAVEQVVLLRDDVSLAVGETLVVDVDMNFTSQEMDFGLAISDTDTPTPASGADADTRDTFDWASVAVRPSQNNIRVNQSVDGAVNTATGAISGVSESTVSALYITRISATQFTLGYTNTSDVSTNATTVSFTDTDNANAIGFYADLRSSGTLGSFDNLRILGSDEIVLDETLTVAGDVILGDQSVLEFDVLDLDTADLLDIGGNLNAAGILSVTLDPSAPAPALDDVFDILDFASATGGFAAYDLPDLPGGLAWNVSSLLTSGELHVVTDVDLDNDGDVDGRDFLAIQRTDSTLVTAWQEQYGDSIAVAALSSVQSVPEPGGEVLLMVFICAVLFRPHWSNFT